MRQDGVEFLTARERDCLRLAAEGLTSGEIASRLGISTSRVDNLCLDARRKLGGLSRRAAARRLLELESGGQVLPGHPMPGAPADPVVLSDPSRAQWRDPAHVREDRAVFEGIEPPPVQLRGSRGARDDLSGVDRLVRAAKLATFIALGLSASIQARHFFEWVSKMVLAHYQ